MTRTDFQPPFAPRALAGICALIALGTTQAALPARAETTDSTIPILRSETAVSHANFQRQTDRLQIASAGDGLLTRPLTIESAVASNAVTAGRGGQNPTDLIPRPFPVALRLGALVSPRTKFIGGIDVTLPGAGIGQNWATRLDAEAIVSANFGGISTLIPVTVNEVYSKGIVGGNRVYGGLGVGAYIGGITRFGGKVFLGADFTSRLSGEVGVHFAGAGDPLVTTQVRIHL